MADTLVFGATTITFDGIVDIARGRTAMNSEDFGAYDGESRQAASKRSTADMQITFRFVTDAVAVRVKVKELVELITPNMDEDMIITVYFADGGTIIWTGKIVDERGTFEGGKAATSYMGTLDLNTKTEVFS